MSKEKALQPVEQKSVIFYDDEITAVLVDDENGQTVYVPVRPICDFMGVNWDGQRRRIQRDMVLSVEIKRVVVTTTDTRHDEMPREMMCLPLKYIPGWLFGITASRVRVELQDKIIRYQRECYDVLADAFLTPDVSVEPTNSGDEVLLQLHNMALVIAATTKEMLQTKQLAVDNKSRLDIAREYIRGMNKRLTTVERTLQAKTLTEEQAREIQHRVNLLAQTMSQTESNKVHHQTIYETLRHETGATSYKRIPAKGYEAAIRFLDDWLGALGDKE